MSTHELYTLPADQATWDVTMAGDARFTWEYADGRERLLALYQKGKDKQWDQTKRIDWDLEVDPYDPLGLPDDFNPLYGLEVWNRIGERGRQEVRHHMAAWQFSQFLHGEQGALICASRIVESVPDLDSKFYAATQVMDEARHAETYARFLQEKLGLLYPVNTHLKALLEDTLTDSRWDMPYLGMQVLIEGLALAAFGMLRDVTSKPLPLQILAYVMQDEARHVAFGRMALRDYYRSLTEAERREREDFVVEGCYLMRDRFRGQEVWENLGFDVDECVAYVDQAQLMGEFRKALFSRVVPTVKRIGLWGPKVQKAFVDMGVIHFEDVDIDDLFEQDESIAEEMDRMLAERELLRGNRDATIDSDGRGEQLAATIAAGEEEED